MTPLDAAARYTGLGWRVVPITPGGKAPLVKDWPIAATTNPVQIGSWWARWPDAGVGIATGAASGIVVLDVDVKPDQGVHGDESLIDLEATFAPLPATVEAVTGTGGRHLYFRAPAGIAIPSRGGWPGPWLDVRGEGGQVLAPPTVHPNGQPYTWLIGHEPGDPDSVPLADLPDWLLELLTAAPAGTPRAERVPYEGDPRPGDRFAAEHTWPELLTADGATYLGTRTHHAASQSYELWARPGADHVGATLYYAGTDLLKVFSSNWPGLVAGETYTRFGYWAATRFAGDFDAAARHLGEQQAALALDGWVGEAGKVAPARTAPPPPTAPDRPVVFVNGRTLDAVAHDITHHLAAANDPPTLFVRAGMPTRVRADETGRPLIEPLDAEHLRWHATATMRFARRNTDKGPTPCIPGVDIFRSLTKAPAWPFPALVGITEAPIVTPCGAIHTDHGYEPATRLYHWHHGPAYPPIPDEPTPDDLAAAVALVTELLCDFPFDTSADRANAWALLITHLVRPLVTGQVPLAVLDAPEPGTGKSLLAEVVAIVATGRTAAIQPMPDEGEELEKRLTGTLLAGATVVIFDNIEHTLRSPVLAAALTADTWQGRILGRTGQIEVPNRATWMVTGNNIDVGGDLARRCYRIRLDARQARPWERDGFLHADLKGWATTNRPQLLAALCTIIRSWWQAGRPAGPGVAAMGGYTPWVRTVGGILHHAGVEDFLANLTAFHAAADTDAQEAEAFLTAWQALFGDQFVTVADAIRFMEASDSELRDALPGDLVGWWERPPFAKRLGRWLLKRAGRHYGEAGVHIVRGPMARTKVVTWSVETRSAAGYSQDPATTPQATGMVQGMQGHHTPICREGDFSIERGETNPQNPPNPAVPLDDGEGLF